MSLEPKKSGMRILIAEDDRVSRHVLLTMLIKWGYDVVAVNDGAYQDAVLGGRVLKWKGK